MWRAPKHRPSKLDQGSLEQVALQGAFPACSAILVLQRQGNGSENVDSNVSGHWQWDLLPPVLKDRSGSVP